jgi:hypothetical protein
MSWRWVFKRNQGPVDCPGVPAFSRVAALRDSFFVKLHQTEGKQHDVKEKQP